MESRADQIAVLLLSLAALAFVLWRFAFAKKPPACAPGAKAKPQVILGGNLARGLKKTKAAPPRG